VSRRIENFLGFNELNRSIRRQADLHARSFLLISVLSAPCPCVSVFCVGEEMMAALEPLAFFLIWFITKG